MKRLTPEREQQIRGMSFKENRDAWPFHIEELLEEIEALRAELKAAQTAGMVSFANRYGTYAGPDSYALSQGLPQTPDEEAQ